VGVNIYSVFYSVKPFNHFSLKEQVLILDILVLSIACTHRV